MPALSQGAGRSAIADFSACGAGRGRGGPVPGVARGGNAKELGALGSATAWINSPPLTAADLRGKVVLVDIWTYT
jgi:hypothetical protein